MDVVSWGRFPRPTSFWLGRFFSLDNELLGHRRDWPAWWNDLPVRFGSASKGLEGLGNLLFGCFSQNVFFDDSKIFLDRPFGRSNLPNHLVQKHIQTLWDAGELDPALTKIGGGKFEERMLEETVKMMCRLWWFTQSEKKNFAVGSVASFDFALPVGLRIV